MKDTATARVTLTIDIRVNGSWGEECTIGQMRDQAKAAAEGAIKRAMQNYDAKIIGEMKVASVIQIEGK